MRRLWHLKFFRFLLIALGFILLLALVVFLAREPLRAYLADVTGEEDPSFQIRALGYLALSLVQPAHDTADYAPIRFNDYSPFGVNTFFEQEVDESKIRTSMQMLHDAGFKWIRQEFPWEDIEQPGKGQYFDTKFNHSTWDKYDRIVELAHEYGLEIIARLDHPPAWTRHDGRARGDFAPPDNYDDYGDFVATVVSRYRGKIKFYQLWNEPNIYPEWGEQPVNANDYTRLLKIGYTRAKQADPNVVIISAGLAQTTETGPKNLNDVTFLQQMYAAGAQNYFDILAVQDYGLFTGPGDRRVEFNRTNFSRPILIREIMVQNGDANKPIWAMEIGWNAAPANVEPIYGRVTVQQQAHYAVQAYERARDEWPWMGPMLYWFFKRADDHEINQPFYFFRMLEPDFTPHPVWDALKNYIASARVVGLGTHSLEHWAIDWYGDWTVHVDNTQPFGNYVTGAAGDEFVFAFRGTDLDLMTADPYGGSVRVRVDNHDLGEFDLRATDTYANHEIPLVRDLPDDEHHVQVTLARGEPILTGLVVRRSNTWIRDTLFALALIVGSIIGLRATLKA